jgi:hypothetical protein
VSAWLIFQVVETIFRAFGSGDALQFSAALPEPKLRISVGA